MCVIESSTYRENCIKKSCKVAEKLSKNDTIFRQFCLFLDCGICRRVRRFPPETNNVHPSFLITMEQSASKYLVKWPRYKPSTKGSVFHVFLSNWKTMRVSKSTRLSELFVFSPSIMCEIPSSVSWLFFCSGLKKKKKKKKKAISWFKLCSAVVCDKDICV